MPQHEDESSDEDYKPFNFVMIIKNQQHWRQPRGLIRLGTPMKLTSSAGQQGEAST
jgi:hypothetical protein